MKIQVEQTGHLLDSKQWEEKTGETHEKMG